VPSLTTWNASRTERASSSWSSIAFLYPWNGSRVATSITVAEHLAALGQPGLVGLPGAAGTRSSSRARGVSACVIPGEVDHPGQLLRAAPARLDRLGRHVMPHVLVDPKDDHALEPGQVGVRDPAAAA
jgi:hypothetical protein